jgi:hypothetical protein
MYTNKFYIFILLIFSFLGGYAQLDGKKQSENYLEENLFLNGELTDYYTGESLGGVAVKATANGKKIAQGTTDSKGEFEMVLDYDNEYRIDFSRGGYITKTIIISTKGVPEKKKRQCPDMEVEITLFKPNKCIKKDIMKKPIGKAIYFPKKNRIDWDMVYSGPLIQSLNKKLDDCAEQIAREEETYKELIKTADKAFSKKDWETAKGNYTEALKIFPNEKDPKNKINLIETEIAKKAEAEKQRAEEKARAKAEALAKAEAESAAKKAEEERIAKEKAEKEALAKAKAEAIQKSKAETAAKKAEEERVAKEKAKAEAKLKAEAEEKNRLKEEAAAKKAAEQKAKAEEAIALKKMKEEGKAKLLAEKEAKKRREAEAKALADKKLALQTAEKERKAKELAAKKALQAERERKENEKIIQVANKKIEDQIKQETEKKVIIEQTTTIKTPAKTKGNPAIKIKRKNKTRHLYEKPNKHKKGKGPTLKKRIVL